MSPAAVVLSAVPTLFSSDGEVDLDANRTLYKQVDGLLDGLFVAGTTGEFPALEDSERLSLIEVALAEAAGLAGAKISGSAAEELADYVAAAPGLRIFSGNDSDPAAAMRAGGAGVISGRSGAYPEVYAALATALTAGDEEAAARHQLVLDRIVALGASIGRVKYALQLRGRGGTTARMTVDPPDASLSAAIAAEVAAL